MPDWRFCSKRHDCLDVCGKAQERRWHTERRKAWILAALYLEYKKFHEGTTRSGSARCKSPALHGLVGDLTPSPRYLYCPSIATVRCSERQAPRPKSRTCIRYAYTRLWMRWLESTLERPTSPWQSCFPTSAFHQCGEITMNLADTPLVPPLGDTGDVMWADYRCRGLWGLSQLHGRHMVRCVTSVW